MASKKKHKKHNFDCPDDMVRHVESVLNGEYDFHMVDIGKPWLVADVGACCGDFALWMQYKAKANKLPVDTIDCFEPNPEALKFLRKNAAWIGCQVIESAVTPHGGYAYLYKGDNNLGESRATDVEYSDLLGESIKVRSMRSLTLNSYDLIKLDCEGGECDIVMDEFFAPVAKVIVMEYHHEDERFRMIDRLEGVHNYRLSDGKVDRRDRGTLTFYKNEYAELVRQHLEAKNR